MPRSTLKEGYLLDKGREALGTTPIEAKPDIILKMPGDSYLPFLLALFSTFMLVALLLHAWFITGLMAAVSGVFTVMWLWPERLLIQREPRIDQHMGDSHE